MNCPAIVTTTYYTEKITKINLIESCELLQPISNAFLLFRLNLQEVGGLDALRGLKGKPPIFSLSVFSGI